MELGARSDCSITCTVRWTSGVPVIAEGTTRVDEVLLTFRVWGDF
jgi:hypothetical protein